MCEESLERKLARIDLNLLISLEALLISKNVTHAARRLGQSQPAVSRSLSRLREVLSDDILVRGSFGLKLTKRGEYLAGIVPAAMSNVRDVLSSRQAESEIRVTFNSSLMPAVLPFLLKSPAKGNKTLKLNTHKTVPEGLSQLHLKMVDYYVGPLLGGNEGIASEVIFSEDFVTLIATERHLFGGIRPTTEQFLSLDHIIIVENGTETFPRFSEALAALARKNVRILEVQDIMAAALMVLDSNLALTLPRSIAGWLTRTMKLCVVLPPFAIPEQAVSLAWIDDGAGTLHRNSIRDVIAVVKEAVASDQAAVRTLRPLEAEG